MSILWMITIKEKKNCLHLLLQVYSLSYNLDKINTSIEWSKVTGPMSLPTFPYPFERSENPLGFLNTICKSKRYSAKA